MKLAKGSAVLMLLVIALVSLMAPVRAQDKPEPMKIIPLKVEVVVTELDGAKKISSLPYTFYVNANDIGNRSTSQVRVGLRVPVTTGSPTNAPTQFQYMDIGTNIDCGASSAPEGRFKLSLSVERSYLTSADEKKVPALAGDGVSVSTLNPIVQHFSSSYNLVVRDGQTIDSTSTTDPITGRVLQISVSVNAVK